MIRDRGDLALKEELTELAVRNPVIYTFCGKLQEYFAIQQFKRAVLAFRGRTEDAEIAQTKSFIDGVDQMLNLLKDLLPKKQR